MASRPKGYGMTAEAQEKIMSKYDEGSASEAMCWINDTLTMADMEGCCTAAKPDDVYKTLQDGVVLCTLMNVLGENIKLNQSKMAFKKMENISNFLMAAEKYGVAKTELFQTVDLFEKQNMPQVVMAIHALGRKVKSRGGYGIGPKDSECQPREWTEEQLKAGQSIIGLQMGSNKGASQAGQNFGKTRAIID